MHNSLLLNRVTPYREKIYMTLSAYIEARHPHPRHPPIARGPCKVTLRSSDPPHSLPREGLKSLSKPICLQWQCSELVYTCIFRVWISALRLQKDCVTSLLYYINIPERTKNRSTLPPLLPPGLEPPGYGQLCAVAFLCSP